MTNTGPSLQNQAGGGSAGSFGALLPVQAWVRNPVLRSWPVLLFIALVAVPPIGLVIIDTHGTVASYLSSIDHASWLFAGYFAVAWLLLIGVIVRPAQVLVGQCDAAATGGRFRLDFDQAAAAPLRAPACVAGAVGRAR